MESAFEGQGEAPGLGIEVNEALARMQPFYGEGSPLQSQEEACYCANGNAFAGGAPVLKDYRVFAISCATQPFCLAFPCARHAGPAQDRHS